MRIKNNFEQALFCTFGNKLLYLWNEKQNCIAYETLRII